MTTRTHTFHIDFPVAAVVGLNVFEFLLLLLNFKFRELSALALQLVKLSDKVDIAPENLRRQRAYFLTEVWYSGCRSSYLVVELVLECY